MDISFYTIKRNRDTSIGYGGAGFKIITSLQELGHRVLFDNPDCRVQLCFTPPHTYRWHPGQYRIGMSPWESTELPHNWLQNMNDCDEVWATSEWTADVFRNSGVTKPVYVYEHGLESKWAPVQRNRGDVVKFLHQGEPALRKGGQMAVDAFRAAFGDRTDVHLTVKAYYQHNIGVWQHGFFLKPDYAYDNVTVITGNLSSQELIDLYAEHDVLVYPSYGEGFGLIPLQALGTGMPVISTGEWAPYRRFLEPLELYGRWDRSVWSLHPGNVLYPNYDMLVGLYRHAFNNIETLQEKFYKQADEVHKAYNWVEKTEQAMEHIVAMNL